MSTQQDQDRATLKELLWGVHSEWGDEALKLEVICPNGERQPRVYVTANTANMDGSPNAQTAASLQIQGEVDGVSIICDGRCAADVIKAWNRAAKRAD